MLQMAVAKRNGLRLLSPPVIRHPRLLYFLLSEGVWAWITKNGRTETRCSLSPLLCKQLAKSLYIHRAVELNMKSQWICSNKAFLWPPLVAENITLVAVQWTYNKTGLWQTAC
jgi:hypothetical protein